MKYSRMETAIEVLIYSAIVLMALCLNLIVKGYLNTTLLRGTVVSLMVIILVGIFMLKKVLDNLRILNKRKYVMQFSQDELHVIEEVVETIEKTGADIPVINIYKVRNKFTSYWAFVRWHEGEISQIFISKRVFDQPKEMQFMIIMHEIMHTVHGCHFMKKFVLEGVNQYLTEWIIKKFTDYEITGKEKAQIRIGKKNIKIPIPIIAYTNNVKYVKKYNLDDEKLFNNYLEGKKGEKFFRKNFNNQCFN